MPTSLTKGLTASHPSSSMETPSTEKPWSLCLRSKSMSHEVHAGIREARSERVPEGVPGDAAKASPPKRRLPTGLEVEEPVAGEGIVKHIRPMLGRLLRFEYGKRRVIERHFQFAAGLAHDDRKPLLL